MKDVNDILREEKRKMEDMFKNMKDELKSNMQMNEVCYLNNFFVIYCYIIYLKYFMDFDWLIAINEFVISV